MDKSALNFALFERYSTPMTEKIPHKLVFSSRSPKRRKRSLYLIAILSLLQLCLIWPVYPLFSSPLPLILGLPQSFVWVIAILLLSFTCVLVYYLKDIREAE